MVLMQFRWLPSPFICENAEMNFEREFAASCHSGRQGQRAHRRACWALCCWLREPRGQGRGPGRKAGPRVGPGRVRAGVRWSLHFKLTGVARVEWSSDRAAEVHGWGLLLEGNFGSPLALNSVAPAGGRPRRGELQTRLRECPELARLQTCGRPWRRSVILTMRPPGSQEACGGDHRQGWWWSGPRGDLGHFWTPQCLFSVFLMKPFKN